MKLWDVRMVAEIGTIEVCQHPVNQVCFDRSATVLIAASDDGMVRSYNTVTKEIVCELRGHEDAVQAVVLDPTDSRLVTASSDCTFRIWH